MIIPFTREASRHRDLLGWSLVADATVVAVSGAVLTLGAGALADPLGLPASLMRVTGVVLLPYAAVVMLIATRRQLSRRSAWVVVGLNAFWVVASILLLLTGGVQPNSLGIAFMVIQALIVAGFADVEVLGLRRSA